MKNFLLSVLCLFMASQAFSRSSALSVLVTNHTNCTVYYRIVVDEMCMCGETYSIGTLVLVPGVTASYINSTLWGGT